TRQGSVYACFFICPSTRGKGKVIGRGGSAIRRFTYIWRMEATRNTIYSELLTARQQGKKKLAVLIDPDKLRMGNLDQLIKLAVRCKVDYFFIGGSLLVNNQLDQCLAMIREQCNIPM